MDRQHVIIKLRQHESELKAAGITHLRLFGSVARGEATTDSDIDLMAEFDSTRKLSLLDMVGLENRLSALLQTKVDLSPAKTIRERVRTTAEKDAVLAF